MKITKDLLKELIIEEFSRLREEDPQVANSQPPAEQKLSYTGMKNFSRALLGTETIPASVVDRAREEMQGNPSAAVMAAFIVNLFNAFEVSQAEITRTITAIKKELGGN